MSPRRRDRLEVVTFRPELADDFRRLNLEWLEELFRIEPQDELLFADPQKQIIDAGGSIFFAIWRDDDGVEHVIGTCALLRHGADFELAKMGVAKEHRGHGAGRVLLDASIEFARKAGAHELRLLTNSRLREALELYRSAGFEVVKLGPDPRYERVDTIMSLTLKKIFE